MGEDEEVCKQRITTQMRSAVRALHAAHVRDHTNVVYRSVVIHLQCFISQTLQISNLFISLFLK